LRRFHQWIEQRLLNVGWFEMLSGRRRRFMADVRLFKTGKMAEWQFRAVLRTASNCVIQGSAADVMKLGMITFWRKIRANPKYNGVRIMLQVHDEILLEAPEAIAEEVAAILQESLETCCQIRVPILSEGSVGATSWESAH
jgi:DNA polymerase-1